MKEPLQSKKELSRPLNLKNGKGVFLKRGVTAEMLGFESNRKRGVAMQVKNKQPTPFQDMIKPFFEEGLAVKEIAKRTGKFPSFINTQLRQMGAIHGEEWHERILLKYK